MYPGELTNGCNHTWLYKTFFCVLKQTLKNKCHSVVGKLPNNPVVQCNEAIATEDKGWKLTVVDGGSVTGKCQMQCFRNQ